MTQTKIDYGAIGQKMYYTIGEVCQLTGLKDSVLRHWESEIPKLRPKKNRGGNRAYQVKDIELVMRAKQLIKEEGLPIQTARQRIAEERSEARASRKTTTIAVVPDDGDAGGANIGKDISTNIDTNVGTDNSTIDIDIINKNDDGINANINAEPETEVLQIELSFGYPSAQSDAADDSPASSKILSEIRDGLEDVLKILER